MTRDVHDSQNRVWRFYAAGGVGSQFSAPPDPAAGASTTLVECVRGEERELISAPLNWTDEAAVSEASLRQLLEAKRAGHQVFTDDERRVWRVYSEGRTHGIADSANLGAEDLIFESDTGERRVVERVGLVYGVSPVKKLDSAELAELFARAQRRG